MASHGHEEQPIIIIIEDPQTESRTEYRVDSAVGYSVDKLLQALTTEGGKVQWDRACRLPGR